MQGNGSSPDQTAFVLTGGGSLGAVKVGMLYALDSGYLQTVAWLASDLSQLVA